MKGTGILNLLSCLWAQITDFGLTYGVQDETPIFYLSR